MYEKDKIRKKIILMREKLKGMYDYQYPVDRRVIEDRLNFLEREFFRFDYMINPYHVQPGLILDVDITSIKRKKTTLNGMANVLNEFLHGVSKGFQDAAFASYSRRRSTIREDINQSFGNGESQAASPAHSSQFLDTINSEKPKAIAAPKAKEEAGKKRGRKAGAVRRR